MTPTNGQHTDTAGAGFLTTEAERKALKTLILLKLMGQMQKPGVYHVRMTHDNGCPAILSQQAALCNCNPITALSTEQEFIEALTQNREQRRAAQRAARKSVGKSGAV